MTCQNHNSCIHVALSSPFTAKKVGEVVEIEGIILREGTFTDRDGKTFHYSKDLLEKSKDSFVGVPIVYPHTEDEEGASKILGKVGGFTTETFMKGNELWYKGIVYKDDLIADVLTNKLDSHSIEAGVEAVMDANIGCANVVTLSGEAVALTNRPSCVDCKVKKCMVTSELKLEEDSSRGTPLLPSWRSEFGVGSGVAEGEVLEDFSLNGHNLENEKGERVKMEDEQEHEEPVNAEEALIEIQRLANQYPGASKPWAEMTSTEKAAACKANGFVKSKMEQVHNMELSAVAYALKAAGIDKAKIAEILKKLQEKYPSPAADTAKHGGVDLDEIFGESPELISLRQEKDKLEKDLTKMTEDKLTVELEQVLKDVRGIDKTFDDKTFFEGIACTKDKIAMAKRFKVQLERIRKPVSVQGVSDVAVANVNRISMEEFGATPDELLKDLVPEAFLAKEK